MDPPTSWDSLRKQARKLEAQLDEQMPLYRKVVSKKVDDGTDKDLESGIDELLQQLHQVNSHMQAWVSSGGSEIFSHTLTRHQEILQDLTQEFNRLRSSLRAKKEHASLLEDFREFDRTRLDMEDGGGSYEQALLKEHAAVSRSTGQTDGILQFDFSGESNPLINKEEKVHGHYNPFLSCLCLHIPHFDLLVEQIVDVAGLVMKSRDSLPSTILLANTLLVCQ
ncbi:hypothetical protein RHGRI_005608 [Rhododendron griersonianum]|uniref:Golgi SNAP receptor complex member 1 n=1 Tax=Rhododendron griersonianum TaxID=479676 RepID=A0AAV6LE01_9ERIC|nr:hypothetical protein RHGRI_005608 [Rhododendron griersonianum]